LWRGRRGQDEGRGRARGVGRAGYGDPYIGLLQRRRVVDAVAGHADDEAALLQRLDDRIFMLRKDAGETVRRLDFRRDVRRDDALGRVAGEKVRRRLNIDAEPSSPAICRAIATSSPVTILILTP